jgi:hypothetical protein
MAPTAASLAVACRGVVIRVHAPIARLDEDTISERPSPSERIEEAELLTPTGDCPPPETESRVTGISGQDSLGGLIQLSITLQPEFLYPTGTGVSESVRLRLLGPRRPNGRLAG